MANDYRLDENGDLFYSGTDFEKIEGGAHAAQSVSVTILTLQGEYLYDFTLGVPYFKLIFQVNVPLSIKRQLLVSVVNNHYLIQKVTRFKLEIDPKEKKGFFTFTATTVEGVAVQGAITL